MTLTLPLVNIQVVRTTETSRSSNSITAMDICNQTNKSVEVQLKKHVKT